MPFEIRNRAVHEPFQNRHILHGLTGFPAHPADLPWERLDCFSQHWACRGGGQVFAREARWRHGQMSSLLCCGCMQHSSTFRAGVCLGAGFQCPSCVYIIALHCITLHGIGLHIVSYHVITRLHNYILHTYVHTYTRTCVHPNIDLHTGRQLFTQAYIRAYIGTHMVWQ